MNRNMHRNDFLSALIEGNRDFCSDFVTRRLRDDPSLTAVYEDLLRPALYDVGLLWETNKISVATEHMATAIIEGILNEHHSRVVSKKRIGKKVLAACVENEYHQVGIRMVADIFEMNGWDTFFLGANMPCQDLIAFAELKSPDLIALSLSLSGNLPSLENMIQALKAAFPETSIMIGGQAFFREKTGLSGAYKDIPLIPDVRILDEYLRGFSGAKTSA